MESRGLRVKKKALVALVTLGAALAAVAAFAYWTTSGSGSGTAAVGTNEAVTITATVPAGIAPGTSKQVSFLAANPAKSAVRVTTVHLAEVKVDAGHSTCKVAAFTMPDVTENREVPAEATADPLPNPGTLTFANTAENQDACKNATLTLVLTSS